MFRRRNGAIPRPAPVLQGFRGILEVTPEAGRVYVRATRSEGGIFGEARAQRRSFSLAFSLASISDNASLLKTNTAVDQR